MIIGTAGHIDHGKTSLIAALTGRDTDRLPEEKRRGISIELGYAYWPTPSGVLGFVDVPGHERFVHAMVSGATGIDFALLVIAADDGPMPQTKEHLDILRLLGVNRGAIVLTKIDLVDAIFADESIAGIRSVTDQTPAQNWPIFPVSTKTGEGIDLLRQHLQEAMRIETPIIDSGVFRLAVDRSFTLSGIGTVVTGTVHAGRVAVGDDVLLMAARSRRVRVRSIYAQDRPSDHGLRGQRVALNLVGASVEEVPRGSWINGDGLDNLVSRFDVLLNNSDWHDRSITQGLEVHLHHGTDDLLARLYPLDCDRLSPGTAGIVSVIAPQPLAVCVQDRFLVRDSQAMTTLGGGVVLDTAPPARGKRAPQRLSALRAIAHADSATALRAILTVTNYPISRLRQSWNISQATADQISSGLPRAAGILFDPEIWRGLVQSVQQAVVETHLREPEMPGIELNRCRRVACPALSPDAFDDLVGGLIAQGVLQRRGVFLALPTHEARLSAAEEALWRSLEPLLRENSFNPPRVRDIANQVNIPEAEIRANLRRVARKGDVTLVALDHFFPTDVVARLADIAAEIAQRDGTIRAASFRDVIGGGRKVAIQILEFFDRVGFTRRVGETHIVRSQNLWRSE